MEMDNASSLIFQTTHPDNPVLRSSPIAHPEDLSIELMGPSVPHLVGCFRVDLVPKRVGRKPIPPPLVQERRPCSQECIGFIGHADFSLSTRQSRAQF